MPRNSLQAQIPADALRNRLEPRGHVSDFAEILEPAQRETMEQRLIQLKDETGVEVAVVTLESLEGGEIDDFTNRLLDSWRVGPRGDDRGVMLLMALKDRVARIEVGYGLEETLTDSWAGRVLEEDVFPAFREGRYSEGLELAVQRILEMVEHGEQPLSGESGDADQETDWAVEVFLSLFLGVFVAIGAVLAGAGFSARVISLLVFGVFFAAIAIFVGCNVTLLGRYLLPLVAILTASIGWVWGRKSASTFRKTGRRGRTKGWTWGNSDSTGGSSGGFGGFGGGRSGGGGASGRW